jgi:hypothetical protein
MRLPPTAKPVVISVLAIAVPATLVAAYAQTLPGDRPRPEPRPEGSAQVLRPFALRRRVSQLGSEGVAEQPPARRLRYRGFLRAAMVA